MENKEILNEVEVEIEEDADYDELLKKFEEPEITSKPKKRKKALGIIITIILIGILIALLVFLVNNNNTQNNIDSEEAKITAETDSDRIWQVQAETDEKGNVKQNGTGKLLQYIPEKIRNIKVENFFGSYSVNSYTPKSQTAETNPETGETSEETSKTEYTLIGYEDFKLEDGAPDDLANDCAALEFTKIIKANAGNSLKDFGLDKPRAVVTVTFTDKTKAVIKVGADALQGAGTYVTFGNADTVYLVATESIDAFLKDKKDLLSLTINKTAEDNADASFTSVTLSGKAFGDKIVLKPNDFTNSIASTYVITSPKKIYADDNEASSISGGIRGLLAGNVVSINPTKADKDKFGISDNYAHIVAEYPDVTVDLIASEPDKEGNCYLMEKDGKIIYQISSTSIKWVNTSLSELESEYIINPKLQGLTKMTVKTDKVYNFILNTKTTQTTDEEGNTSDSTTTTVHFENKELTLGNFETYFSNVALLTKSNRSAAKPKGKGDFTILYDYTGAKDSDTIVFYKDGDGKHTVTVNSIVVGQVYSSYVEKIIQQTSEIAQDKILKSLW